MSALYLKQMYPERELNPHSNYLPQDFKSCVSTNSTIRALTKEQQRTLRACLPKLTRRQVYQFHHQGIKLKNNNALRACLPKLTRRQVYQFHHQGILSQ
jgi:hypothetical protein